MKKTKLVSLITLLFTFLFFTKCSEDAVIYSALTGKVTYTNASGTAANANGAVVTLENSTAGKSITSVANSTGDYAFENLKAGSYKLSATFYTENKNAAGRLDGLTFATETAIDVAMPSANFTKDLTLVSIGQAGAFEALSAAYSWNGAAYANTGAWTFDNVHSPILFEFSYRGNEADFSGSFGQVSKYNVSVDPANLSTASIEVEVDLASVNTRTPGGRDNRTTVADNPTFSPASLFTELGCIAGTFGITADSIATEAKPKQITLDVDRYAKFTSTSVSKLGDGFVAKGDLTFHGVTKATEVWFKLVAPWTDSSNNRKYSGFESKFLMKAKSDFGITSCSVNDAEIRIYMSTVLYKQL